MRSLFRFLRDRRFSYEPLVEVRVSKDALLHNFHTFLKCLEVRPPFGGPTSKYGIAPVLKANAYGHGLIEVAHVLEGQSRAAFFVVDSFYEALQLRNENIQTPILVIGHTLTKNILSSTLNDVSFAVGSLTQLEELGVADVAVALHLKFDTGMHRQGIPPKELSKAIEVVSLYPKVRVEGVCSHLADADSDDDTKTTMQIRLWNDITSKWRAAFPNTKYFHLSATAGVRFAEKIDANVGRLGIGLYGISDAVSGLIPALSMHTRITAVRTVERGESVGYNNTWTAERETVVATIPVGYYEGVDRRLSNKGFVRVRGKECPIIGRVSMDMMTVDVTDIPDVKEGNGVEAIGTDSQAQNSVARMAELCGTIPYDILVHIPTALRRVVV